jgi:hypothetical protein
MLRGVKKLDFKFTLTMAAYDLIKLPTGNGGALQARRQRQTRIRRYLGYIFSSLLDRAKF